MSLMQMKSAEPAQETPWFGVRVRSRSEQLAAAGLAGRGYQPLLPVYTVERRWSDRIRKVDVPLFPGYLFCRFDPRRKLAVLTAPGVLQVVGIGNVPAPIAEEEIDAIRAVVASGIPAQPWPFTREGERVALVSGPLRGVKGIVQKVKSNRQLILSITLLQRAVSVDVAASWVEPVH